MNAPTLNPGTLFAKDYRIVRRLNGGGMGDVYLAEQLSVNTIRALKLMKPQLLRDPDLRRRFEQEAKIGARIASEHVVQVVAAGVDEESEVPWIAMEYLEGEDLSALLTQRGALTLTDTVEILRQICHAVGAAHEASIVHRDLKPENIMISQSRRSDVPMTVKVLDFGISKIVTQSNTVGTATIGTPQWMAPEQSSGEAVGPPADVWALGLIAFRMLAGRPYWQHANSLTPSMVSIMREVVLDPLQQASQRAHQLGCAQSLPTGFDAWFSRCVVREVKSRFLDAGAAFAAFEASVIRHAPLPLLPSSQSRLPPWVRWRLGGAALAASIVIGAVAGRQPPRPPPPVEPTPVTPPAVQTAEEHHAQQLAQCREKIGSPAPRIAACKPLCLVEHEPESCVRLGGLVAASDGVEAAHAYRIACDKQNLEGCKNLLALYDDGGPNLPTDKGKVVELSKLLCEKHAHAESCMKGGRILMDKGVLQNQTDGRRLFKTACAQDKTVYKEACQLATVRQPTTLSDKCRRGDLQSCLEGCKKGNIEHCVGSMASACQLIDNGDLCFTGGMFYVLGPQISPSLRRDIPRARKLLQRGCEGGHQNSCVALSKIRDALGMAH